MPTVQSRNNIRTYYLQRGALKLILKGILRPLYTCILGRRILTKSMCNLCKGGYLIVQELCREVGGRGQKFSKVRYFNYVQPLNTVKKKSCYFQAKRTN